MGPVGFARWLAAAVATTALACPSASAAPALDRFYVKGAQYPTNLIRGPDGALWFATTRALGRMGGGGDVTFRGTAPLDPEGLTAGPDGALWFTDNDSRIGRMGMDGRMTVFTQGISSNPTSIASGPDGALWFAEPGSQQLGRITTDGHVTERQLPDGTFPSAVTAGPDGNVWFSWSFGVGRATPAGDVRLWRMTNDPGLASDQSIALGPDGNLWAAGLDYRDLLRVTPDGVATHVTAGTLVDQVAAGPDGNLWFAYYFGVGSVAPDGSHRRTWPQPFGTSSDCTRYSGTGPGGGLAFDSAGSLWTADSYHRSLERLAFGPAAPSPLEPFLPRTGALRSPISLAAGEDGAIWVATEDALVQVGAAGELHAFPSRGMTGALLPRSDGVWFGARGEIRRRSPSGRIERFRRGRGPRAHAGALALGPDGNVWFVDTAKGTIGRVTRGGRVRESARGLGRRRSLLTIARGGAYLWVTDQRGAIDRVRTDGTVRRFRSGLSRHAIPTAIAPGPDGNMWFTDFDHRRVGRITPDGRITEWIVPDRPASIAAGPDGALWFTTSAASDVDNQAGVGRITVNGDVSEYYSRDTCVTPYQGLATGPDGKVWFLESRGPVAVARIDPSKLGFT